MTPGQALEQIAYICITRHPDQDGNTIPEDIEKLLKQYFSIQYAAAESKFYIETQKAIETFEQLDPNVRETVFEHFGR